MMLITFDWFSAYFNVCLTILWELSIIGLKKAYKSEKGFWEIKL